MPGGRRSCRSLALLNRAFRALRGTARLSTVLALGALSGGGLACGVLVSFDDYVTESTQPFTVKGSVDGLEGESVILTVNGTSQTVVGNGDFSIVLSIAGGASFFVTASAHAHTCSVERGNSVVTGAAWTGVAVHCASSDPTATGLTLSGGALAPAFDPARLSYDALLSWREPQATLTLTTRSARGRFSVDDGPPQASGTPSAPFSVESTRQVAVSALAADGTRSPNPYAIAIRRSDYLKPSAIAPLLGRGGVGAEFGSAVALSGDGRTLAIGAPYEAGGSKGVGGDPTQLTVPGSGAVYVFTRGNGAWVQQAYVKASNAGTNARFGFSVALSEAGDRLVVGASAESNPGSGVNGEQTGTSLNPAGAVYAFSRVGESWAQEAYLKASNTSTQGAFGRFGSSVTLSASGDILAVGAPTEAGMAIGADGSQDIGPQAYAGAVYVFARQSGVWSQRAYLKAAAVDQALFGTSVALSADGLELAVGAPGDSSAARGVGGAATPGGLPSAGAAYVFVDAGEAASWSRQAYVKASNTATTAAFGTAVALSANGQTLAVGAPGESSGAVGIDGDQNDTTAAISGAVYVLSRTGVVWSQDAYVKASNTQTGASFGTAVALSGDGAELVVGAPREGGAANGVNGDQTPTSTTATSGAAYVYLRSGTWAQRAYLKASLPRARAAMGSAVSVGADGLNILVGARLEASGAVGVNGDPNDQTAPDTGAAYVF